MALLDRFRARPAWQSPDPQVRVAAVRQLGAEQSDVVASIARDDADPRGEHKDVAVAAGGRLDDTEALEAVAARARNSAAARRARGVLDARPGASVVASEAVPSEPAPETPPLPAEPPPPPPAPPD